jgi:hypothetical protein
MARSAKSRILLARRRCSVRTPRRQAAALAAFALLFSSVCPQVSSQTKPGEYAVKAAYLYDFGKFVQWPDFPGDHSAFTICVLGRDPFGPALDDVIKNEQIAGLPLAARRITSLQDSGNCQIVFISSSEEDNLTKLFGELANLPVLTVSDADDFVTRGGIIGFVLQQNKVRFEVNLSAAQNARLTLSSQLLKVAASVKGGPKSSTSPRR